MACDTRSTIFFHDKTPHRGAGAMPAASGHPTAPARRTRASLLRIPRRWLVGLWRMLRSIG
jgi:hypothetical protein